MNKRALAKQLESQYNCFKAQAKPAKAEQRPTEKPAGLCTSSLHGSADILQHLPLRAPCNRIPPALEPFGGNQRQIRKVDQAVPIDVIHRRM